MMKRLPFKRIKWPGWVVLILLGLFMVIGIGKWVGDSSAKEVDKENTIEFEQETDETERYTILVTKPIIDNRSLEKTIEEWIEEQKEMFFSEVESEKDQLGSGSRAHLTIQADAKLGAKDTTSLIFNANHLVDTGSSENHVKVFTVDANHNRLKISDLLTSYGKTLENVRATLEKQLKQNDQYNKELIDQRLSELLSAPDSWNWLAHEGSLIFYMEKSNLTENGEGPIEIKLPLEEENTAATAEREPPLLKPGEKYVALTFDDGPNPNVTPRVLKILKQHQAKATFFMLGSQVEKNPSLAAQVASAGHEIGNHTDQHMNLTKLGESRIQKEFQSSTQKIQDATGEAPTLIRPPYGAINSEVEEVASRNGASLILWSVDSLDWKSKNVDAINQVVNKEVVSGSIILLHDVHPTTADALPRLLTTLEDEGYHFLTVSQLLAMQDHYSAGTYYGNT
ncbi:polysaccharide deacetylase family protein [Guptibacillus spartinae]|uniref:polysaccharide deacetylase family protein n=1 Tax=Guptibacillus spartinae TaxID=3025679 RepID=UPI002360819F|nr:polysaccharide deacetylase family protein [Pseudalkalibacillus spartinae]